MRQIIATRLFVPAGATVYLPAFDMDGGNAVQVEYEVLAVASTVRLTVQQGNDLQNWDTVVTDTARAVIGSFQFTASGIASRYARVFASGAGGIFDACVNTQRL